MSVEVLDHRGSPSYLLGSEQVLSSASIGKLLLLADVARQVDAGELAGELQLSRTEDDAISDNLTTNVQLRRVGLVRFATRGELAAVQCGPDPVDAVLRGMRAIGAFVNELSDAG